MNKKCPKCGCAVKPPKVDVGLYRCGRCGGVFDDTPDEGGDFFEDPTRRAEIEDERRARKGHVRRKTR